MLPFLTPPRPRASASADATAAADEGGHRTLPASARDLAALGSWAAQRRGGRWVHAGGGDHDGDNDSARARGDAMVVDDDEEASAPPPMPLERYASTPLRAAAMAVAATVSCDDIFRNGAARFVAPVVLVLAQPSPPRPRRDAASAVAEEAAAVASALAAAAERPSAALAVAAHLVLTPSIGPDGGGGLALVVSRAAALAITESLLGAAPGSNPP